MFRLLPGGFVPFAEYRLDVLVHLGQKPQEFSIAQRCFIDGSQFLAMESRQRRESYLDSVLLQFTSPAPDNAPVDHDWGAEDSMTRGCTLGMKGIERGTTIGVSDRVFIVDGQ